MWQIQNYMNDDVISGMISKQYIYTEFQKSQKIVILSSFNLVKYFSLDSLK